MTKGALPSEVTVLKLAYNNSHAKKSTSFRMEGATRASPGTED